MKLKATRISKGLTQLQLAEKSGVALKTIQKYETGERDISVASVSTVYKLAKALECRMEDLFEKAPE